MRRRGARHGGSGRGSRPGVARRVRGQRGAVRRDAADAAATKLIEQIPGVDSFKPQTDPKTGKVEITAHNHGFALKAPTEGIFTTVYGRGEVTHVGLNDGVVEGLRLIDRPAFSVQYHPEAAAGPHDANYLFDRFVKLMEESAK